MFIGSYSAPVAKSLKAKVMASLLALAAAVALPQAAHLLGYATGTGNAIGSILLPMHFAIIALGLFAGPYAGLVAGAMSPVVSYMGYALCRGIALHGSGACGLRLRRRSRRF